MTPRLYVVGQRRDGSYVIFHVDNVPDGEGLDTAERYCAGYRLKYIHCTRHRCDDSVAKANREIAP